MSTYPLPFLATGSSSSPYKFPPSLTLTNDAALEDILADLPFFSVGLLAIGVFTFFFVMRRINTVTIYAHVSAFLAFIAAILDLGQILRRGSVNTSRGYGLASVEPLIVARELSLAASIGIRFLFFWQFVSEPPRGELSPLPIPDDRRPNFITLDSESTIHGGSWAKWGFLGFLLKWSLLLLSVAIPILEAIWRLAAAFTRFGPVYNVEATLQITVSALFVLKLLANTWLTPLTPRWRTIRDYSPIFLALLISLGLGIGNILCFEFSESSLGRLLQAIEMYILVLFVLISAFYKIPVRTSVVLDLVQRRLDASPFNPLPANSVGSSFRIDVPRISTPELVIGGGPVMSNERPTLRTRMSTASKISSWLMARGMSGRVSSDRDQTRLWNQDDAELGQSPVDQKSMRGSSFEQTPMEPRETATWRDPVFSSVVSHENKLGPGFDPPRTPSPVISRHSVDSRPVSQSYPSRASSLFTDSRTLPSYYQSANGRRQSSINTTTKQIARNSAVPSPIFGLNGIIRNLQVPEVDDVREADNTMSARSSGMESLLRQQLDLDRSIAGLRLFSPELRENKALELPTSRGTTESVRSDFSLKDFPEPPLHAKSTASSLPITPTVESMDATPNEGSKGVDNSFVVEDISFQLLPPRMPAAGTGSSQLQLLPSTTRDSVTSDLGARVQRLDSQGTQYDVTSFIGRLTTPVENRRESPMSSISEQAPVSESGSLAAIVDIRHHGPSSLTRAQLVDSQGISDPSLQPLDPGSSAAGITVPPPSNSPTYSRLPQVQQGNSPRGLGLGRGGGGLPPRPRLPVSSPIPNATLDERRAYLRPRPAPLVIPDGKEKGIAASGGEFF